MDKDVAGHILCSNWIPSKLGKDAIINSLNLKNPEKCSFNEGLHRIHTNNRDQNPNSILISPKLGDWNLIMGCQLMYTKLSKRITEKLSNAEQESFSFGVDIWCGYLFWMYSENGKLKRYYLFDDGEIEEEGESVYDEMINEDDYDKSIFDLSKMIGFDMDEIKVEDMEREATLFHFDYEIGWLK